MSEQRDDDNRDCDDSQDNDGWQCEAECDEFLHELVPSLSLVLCCFSSVRVFLCLSGSRFFFRDRAVITHCRVSGLILGYKRLCQDRRGARPLPTDPMCAIPLHDFHIRN